MVWPSNQNLRKFKWEVNLASPWPMGWPSINESTRQLLPVLYKLQSLLSSLFQHAVLTQTSWGLQQVDFRNRRMPGNQILCFRSIGHDAQMQMTVSLVYKLIAKVKRWFEFQPEALSKFLHLCLSAWHIRISFTVSTARTLGCKLWHKDTITM